MIASPRDDTCLDTTMLRQAHVRTDESGAAYKSGAPKRQRHTQKKHIHCDMAYSMRGSSKQPKTDDCNWRSAMDRSGYSVTPSRWNLPPKQLRERKEEIFSFAEFPRKMEETFDRTKEMILEKGATVEIPIGPDDDIHLGAKWNTMRAIYDDFCVQLFLCGDERFTKLPISETQWAKMLKRVGRKYGISMSRKGPPEATNVNFKNTYDLVCSVGAAIACGKRSGDAAALTDVVGTEKHFQAMVDLVAACEEKRLTTEASSSIMPFLNMKEVNDTFECFRGSQEPTRRVHNGAAYVMPVAVDMGFSAEDVSYHTSMAAKIVFSRVGKTNNMKEAKSDTSNLTYGVLLDRSARYVNRVPVGMHPYMESKAKTFLMKEFGSSGECSMPCCYSSMQDMHKEADRTRYMQAGSMTEQACTLLYSKWYRESVLSGPMGMCFHTQYPILKACYMLRGVDMDSEIMNNYRLANGLNREFGVRSEATPLEILVARITETPVEEIRAQLEMVHKNQFSTVPG